VDPARGIHGSVQSRRISRINEHPDGKSKGRKRVGPIGHLTSLATSSHRNSCNPVLRKSILFHMDRRIPNSPLQYKRTASSIQHVAISTEFRCHFKQRRSCYVVIRGYLGSSTGYQSSILARERLLSMFQAVTIGLFAAPHGISSFRDLSEI